MPSRRKPSMPKPALSPQRRSGPYCVRKNNTMDALKPNEYQCAMCHGVFEYGWSDDLATKELHQNFGAFDKEDCVLICDDCYQKTGLFCGPPQDWLKDIPKPMREIFRARYDEAARKMAKAFEDHILYGTPLILENIQ